ncbi:condensation domain-containing protein [Streptomyces sp. NPDC057682]|uniref:condensation domain-containing protein n=1 Tax=Streptomyces sp. NPDC057682 TaxID=3346210 RepID=UPI00369A2796
MSDQHVIGATPQAPAGDRLAELAAAVQWEGAGTPSPAAPPGEEPAGLLGPVRVVPAAPAQVQLWLAHTLAPSGLLNDRIILRIEGELRTDALRSAAAGVVAAHSALRTVFRFEDDQVRQHVYAGVEDPLVVRDLPAELGGPVDEDTALRVAQEEGSGEFALEHRPPVRMTLVRVREGLQLLVVALHHISSDQDSPRLLLTELSARYRAETGGTAYALPPALGYDALADRLLAELGEAGTDALARHWSGRLQGVGRARPLPLGTATAADSRGGGGSVETAADPAFGEALRRTAAGLRVSVFAFTLAALRVALWQLTGERDLLVASPFGQRHGADADREIGPLISTLALRNPVDPEASFARLVQAERGEVLTAMAYSRLPHGTLAERAALLGLPALPALPDLLFSYEESEPGPVEFAGLPCEALPIGPIGTAFALSVKAVTGADGAPAIRWIHGAYGREPVRALAEGYLELLRRLVDDPGRPVGSLDSPFDAASFPLPAEVPGRGPAREGARPPHSPTEHAVAAVWAELLGIAAVTDAGQNLFELGAHSLSVARAAARLTDEFGVEVLTTDLFVRGTVAEQAELLDELQLSGFDAADEEELAAALDLMERGGASAEGGSR